MSLPTRKIGSTDVTAIGWGAMGLSAWYGTVLPDEERFKVSHLCSVHDFVDLRLSFSGSRFRLR